MDKLEKELMDIESKLGGSGSTPADVEDKLQWHLDYIESLIEQGGGGSSVADIKVDNTSVVDEEGVAILRTKTAYNASTNKLATEADLGGGGGVYMHMIYFNNGKQKCTVYSTSSTPYTFTSFDTFLKTVGRYETYPAYGQFTDGGIKYQIVSVEDANNTPARLDFRCIVINSTQNTVSFSSVNCYSNAFTKDVVVEM